MNPFGDLTPDEASAMHDRLAADMPGCAEWIAERVGKRTVLDYGCGAGVDSRHYEPGRYVGIDISEPLLAEARRRYPAHDFHHVDSPLPTQDCAILKATLEHLPTCAVARAVLNRALLLVRGPVFIAWHTPPRAQQRLRTVLGASGRDFPQNTYAVAEFAEFKRATTNVERFELWEIHQSP